MQLLGENVWKTITKCARKSRHRYVAVSYLGRGAHKLLPLRKGDSLVVDMSESTVKAGLTDPNEVGKYLAKNVEVYSCSNLHAKVYVFDNTIIIGSANASQNSQRNLIEAGLLSTDREIATRTREFIELLQVEEVTPEYVKWCKKIYNPPKIYGNAKRKHKKVIPLHPPLWLLSVTEDIDRSPEAEKHCKREEKKAKRKIRKKYEVTSLRWTRGAKDRFTQKAKEGDMLIEIWEKWAYPPERIITSSRRTDKFFHLETQKNPQKIHLDTFKNRIKSVGLKIGENTRREIKPPEQKQFILRLFKRERNTAK